ncbi:hypothetical protein EHI42_32535 [Rhizobium hidalgonense]|nr:hypothetical protein EHI42_32535 [Rhizobium hidalgonense]
MTEIGGAFLPNSTSACAPHPPAATDRGRATGLDPSFGPPLAGRRGYAATSPSLANLSQGTSPRPVRE